MSTRARWHFGDAPQVPTIEPSEGLLPIEQAGTPITLADESTLRLALHATLTAEAELDEAGVNCSLKEQAQMTCAMCPLRGEGAVAPLCVIGVQQESLLSRLTVVASRGAD